jgi:hypothetical protein
MLRKKILSIAVLACLVVPAGGAIAGEAQGLGAERTRIDIQAMDYHFMLQDGSDFPSKLDPGQYRFRFHNGSEKRLHEVVMIKLRHGKRIRQLLRMSDKEVEKHIRFIGATGAQPGEDGKPFNARVIRGRYAMLCFVTNRRGAKPHFLKGMIHRFNVDVPWG